MAEVGVVVVISALMNFSHHHPGLACSALVSMSTGSMCVDLLLVRMLLG